MTGTLSKDSYMARYVGKVNPRRRADKAKKQSTAYPSIKKIVSGSNITGYVIGGKVYEAKKKQNRLFKSKQPWEVKSGLFSGLF